MTVGSLLQRLVDWWRTKRTLAAIAGRECRHDGTEPMCSDCIRNAVGW